MITYRCGKVDRNPRHADEGPVEILDGPCGIFMRLVTNKADATMGDELDISDISSLGGKVLAKLGLGN